MLHGAACITLRRASTQVHELDIFANKESGS